jgi:hypothetical protein
MNIQMLELNFILAKSFKFLACPAERGQTSYFFGAPSDRVIRAGLIFFACPNDEVRRVTFFYQEKKVSTSYFFSS